MKRGPSHREDGRQTFQKLEALLLVAHAPVDDELDRLATFVFLQQDHSALDILGVGTFLEQNGQVLVQKLWVFREAVFQDGSVHRVGGVGRLKRVRRSRGPKPALGKTCPNLIQDGLFHRRISPRVVDGDAPHGAPGPTPRRPVLHGRDDRPLSSTNFIKLIRFVEIDKLFEIKSMM